MTTPEGTFLDPRIRKDVTISHEAIATDTVAVAGNDELGPPTRGDDIGAAVVDAPGRVANEHDRAPIVATEEKLERAARETLPPLEARQIIETRVDATSYEDAAQRIIAWALQGASKYVCVAAVNNVMEAHDNDDFRSVMNGADLVTPDGMPLVWGLRLLGVREASRVYGPNLTPAVLDAATAARIKVGFYGGSPKTLQALLGVVHRRWPELEVAYSFSPPFRPMTEAEDEAAVRDMNDSGARIVFVGLGCPKQEIWMSRHRDRLRVVMLGVGAAFDFLAGNKKQAPLIMQKTGTEWIFRLVTEPKRLWKRYVQHNPRFVVLFARQLIQMKYSREN